MRRVVIRLLRWLWLVPVLATVACGGCGGPGGRDREAARPPEPSAPARPHQAGPPPRADIQAAIRVMLEAERHPWLKWPDITRFMPALTTIADEEPDALFWFVDGAPHPALDGAIETLTRADAQGLDPTDFDAATLATHWKQLRAGTKATATEWAEFDAALSVASMRLLSSLHVGRVDPRVVGIAYDVTARRMDPLEALRSARDGAGGLAAAADRVRPQTAVYTRLVDALTAYRELAAGGEPPPVPVLTGRVKKVEPGQTWAGVPTLDARLRLVGDLRPDTPKPDPATEAPVYSKELAAAVERFQDRHALEPDGVVGPSTIEAVNVPFATRVRQLELALERQRWLPDLGRRPYVFVNVPLFRLWATDPASGDEPLRMRVVVGKAVGHATPIFIDEMEYIVFRPYWNPPPSILRSEIVPKARRDPGYLAREELEIVAGGGTGAAALPATPENLDRVLAGKLYLRQRPGPSNSLGLAKFIFPNDEDVYMHGSPAKPLFSRARRDFSHGCIRLEDPARLAEWVLRGDPNWSRERIVAAMEGRAPTQVNLKQKLTVVLFYDTAYADSAGLVHFAGDYYGHDARLEEALRHGFPYPRAG